MLATVSYRGQPSRPERSLKPQRARSNVARTSTTQKAQNHGDPAKLQLPCNRPTDLPREDVSRSPSTGRAEVEKKQPSSVAQSVVPTRSACSKNAHIDERPANRARSGTVPTKPQDLDRVLLKNSKEGPSQSKVKEEETTHSSQPRPTVASESATPASKAFNPPKIIDDEPQASEPSEAPSTTWPVRKVPDDLNEAETCSFLGFVVHARYPCLLHDCCGYQGHETCAERAIHMKVKIGGEKQIQCTGCEAMVATEAAFENHRDLMCHSWARPRSVVLTESLWLEREYLHRVKTPEPWDPLYEMVCSAKQKAKLQ